jgi:hypothetical protein
MATGLKYGGRRFTRKQCKKTPCKKMGFTQKASCRPYKNCYRSTKTRRRRGGANWTFHGFVPQTVNTSAGAPPTVVQAPIGGRRRHRGGNPGGEYSIPPYPSFPATKLAGGKRRKH